MRDRDEIWPKVLEVVRTAGPDGRLYLRVWSEGRDVVHEVITER